MKPLRDTGRSIVHALGYALCRRRYGAMILRRRYRRVHGRPLSEADPRTFTAQLYARMLRVNDEGDRLYTRLADKVAVREHVRERVG